MSKRVLSNLARATGLEPVTYGLTANLIGIKKTSQHRRNQGFFRVGLMYEKISGVHMCKFQVGKKTY